jgi:hypothetical protein
MSGISYAALYEAELSYLATSRILTDGDTGSTFLMFNRDSKSGSNKKDENGGG